MRALSRPFGKLIKAGSGLLLALFTASLAEASPEPGRTAAGRLCDPQSAAKVRKLAPHPKSFGGPVKTVAACAPALLLSDLGAHLQRGKRAPSPDDDEAIQNDAPAARIDVDERQLPALCSLGLIIGSFDRHPRSRAFSPRSPRGPPLPA
jgi:hypothetical protein